MNIPEGGERDKRIFEEIMVKKLSKFDEGFESRCPGSATNKRINSDPHQDV